MKTIILVAIFLLTWTGVNARELPLFDGAVKPNQEWTIIYFTDEWTDKKSEWAVYGQAFQPNSLPEFNGITTLKNGIFGIMIHTDNIDLGDGVKLPSGTIIGHIFFVADSNGIGLLEDLVKIFPDGNRIKVRVDKKKFRQVQIVGGIKKYSKSNKFHHAVYFMATCGLVKEMAAGYKLLIGLNVETVSASLKGSDAALRKVTPSCF